MDSELTELSHSLVVELAGSIGLRNSALANRIMAPIFKPVTDRLAQIGLTFNREVKQVGFSRAMQTPLKDFTTTISARGVPQPPPGGPLLVASNHPGTYDSLIISSQLRRDDLCIISGNIPFLKSLPHARSHFFFIADDANTRMVAMRKAIRHLEQDGALLLYGFGHIDPDPAVYSDASDHIARWSPSIDLFLKLVPRARVLISIVSHVVSQKWRNSLLYHLRQEPIDRRRLVEFGQVMFQLLFPRRLMLSPLISFSQPAKVSELQQESGTERVLPVIIQRAKDLLAQHMDWARTQSKG